MDDSKWEVKKFPFNTYDDPVQEVVCRMIRRSLVMAFSLFKYKQTTDADMYVPTLPLPHDACIEMVLKIVQDQETKCNTEISLDESIPNVADRIEISWLV